MSQVNPFISYSTNPHSPEPSSPIFCILIIGSAVCSIIIYFSGFPTIGGQSFSLFMIIPSLPLSTQQQSIHYC